MITKDWWGGIPESKWSSLLLYLRINPDLTEVLNRADNVLDKYVENPNQELGEQYNAAIAKMCEVDVVQKMDAGDLVQMQTERAVLKEPTEVTEYPAAHTSIGDALAGTSPHLYGMILQSHIGHAKRLTQLISKKLLVLGFDDDVKLCNSLHSLVDRTEKMHRLTHMWYQRRDEALREICRKNSRTIKWMLASNLVMFAAIVFLVATR